MTDRIHLHRDDYPATLTLLAALVGGRAHHDWTTIGYETTDYGAWVDWEQLGASWLSSTEKAVVHIARGCATLETLADRRHDSACRSAPQSPPSPPIRKSLPDGAMPWRTMTVEPGYFQALRTGPVTAFSHHSPMSGSD